MNLSADIYEYQITGHCLHIEDHRLIHKNRVFVLPDNDDGHRIAGELLVEGGAMSLLFLTPWNKITVPLNPNGQISLTQFYSIIPSRDIEWNGTELLWHPVPSIPS